MKSYPPRSWLNPKLEAINSPVHGKGVFVIEAIKKGEVLDRWGGKVYTTKQIENGESNETACQIDDDLWMADSPGVAPSDSDFFNHSCDPNTWMDDEATMSARRDIEIGEEVTVDYALLVAHPGYVTVANCRCKSPLCRHHITGDDWKLLELQERYKGHFPPYYNDVLMDCVDENRQGTIAIYAV